MMTPSTKEWREARAQALRVIIRKYADIAHEADMIVDEAIAESLPRFEHGSFATLVTTTAARRALNRLRDLATDREAYDVLRSEAEEAFETTSLEHEREPEASAPVVTLEQTKAATVAECCRRLARAIGAGTSLDPAPPQDATLKSLHDAAERAAKIVALVGDMPELAVAVRLDDLKALASVTVEWEPQRRRTHRYTDEHGTERTYGSTYAECAVLAILAGSWPRVRVGALPSEVIDDRASAIRVAAQRAIRTTA